jgi:hypothetical protein
MRSPVSLDHAPHRTQCPRTSLFSRGALASIAIATLASASPASACPAMAMSVRPIATKNATMLPDGGVLLSTTRAYRAPANGTFTLVDETGATIETIEEPIAPGLARLAPKQHGDRDLVFTESGLAKFVVQDAAAAPQIAVVPKLARVTSTRTRDAKARGPYPIPSATTIRLASPAPGDTAALVLYGADKIARAWLPATKATSYVLSFGGKGCGSVGMSGAIIGESVMIAFVDKTGRVSAMTKPVKVGRTPPPKPAPATPPVAAPTHAPSSKG